MATTTKPFSQGDYGFITEDNFQIGPLAGESKYLCGAWPGGYNDHPQPILGKLLMRFLPIVTAFILLFLATSFYFGIPSLKSALLSHDWSTVFSILIPVFIVILAILIALVVMAAFGDALLANQNESKLIVKPGVTLLIAHQDYKVSTSTHFGYWYPSGINYDEAAKWSISKDSKTRLVLPTSRQWQMVHITDMPANQVWSLVEDVRSFYGKDR